MRVKKRNFMRGSGLCRFCLSFFLFSMCSVQYEHRRREEAFGSTAANKGRLQQGGDVIQGRYWLPTQRRGSFFPI